MAPAAMATSARLNAGQNGGRLIGDAATHRAFQAWLSEPPRRAPQTIPTRKPRLRSARRQRREPQVQIRARLGRAAGAPARFGPSPLSSPSDPTGAGVGPGAQHELEGLIRDRNEEYPTATAPMLTGSHARVRLFASIRPALGRDSDLHVLDQSVGVDRNRRRPAADAIPAAMRCSASCTSGNDSSCCLRISSRTLASLPPWKATMNGPALPGLLHFGNAVSAAQSHAGCRPGLPEVEQVLLPPQPVECELLAAMFLEAYASGGMRAGRDGQPQRPGTRRRGG